MEVEECEISCFSPSGNANIECDWIRWYFAAHLGASLHTHFASFEFVSVKLSNFTEESKRRCCKKWETSSYLEYIYSTEAKVSLSIAVGKFIFILILIRSMKMCKILNCVV